MDIYTTSQGKRDTQQLGIIVVVLIVVIVIGFLIYWVINNGEENKNIENKEVKQVIENKPAVILSSNVKQSNSKLTENVNQKLVNEDKANAFINNTEAAVQLLTQYANVLESDAALVDAYWGKKKDSKKGDFEDELKDARKKLAEILEEWTELKAVLNDPLKQKQVYKRSTKIADKVKEVYKHIDDAQYDLVFPYRHIFTEYGKYSKNKSEQVYLQKVQPVVLALNNEFNLHKALIPTSLPPAEYQEKLDYIQVPLNQAVDVVNTKDITAETKVNDIEKYYYKLEKNFSKWYKDNIKANVIKYYH